MQVFSTATIQPNPVERWEVTMDLRGKVALVTGSAKRLGRAMALCLADQGMHLAIHWNRSEREALETVEGCRKLGVEAQAVQGDLADPGGTHGIINEAARLGPVQLLVNNASRFIPNQLQGLDAEQIEMDHRIHVVSPAILAREFAADLPPGAQGHIVQMLDWRASIADPHYFTYGLAKAGMLQMMKLLALELAPEIRVNGIAPGSILPPESSEDGDSSPADQVRHAASLKQVTDALLTLLQDPDGCTGQVIAVDGERTRK